MKPRVSTRDQILETLSESPPGLTLKQLAEYCTACEHDEQIVGTMIAILQRENVIHAAPEQRDRATVWVSGKEPVEEHQAPISLAGADRRTPGHVSEAAHVIANMRGGSAAQKRPHTLAAARDADVATMQSAADGQARENVLRILKAHGPLESRGIRKHGSFGHNLPHTLSMMAEQKVLIRLGGGPRSSIFGLPGQTLKDGKNGSAKAREAAKSLENGGEAAVTAAGPATAEESKPAPNEDIHFELERWSGERGGSATPKGGDSLYKAALLDLQDRRDAKAAELAKIDRAIEAMRELA